jgi:lipoate-protein ligase B
MPSPDTEISLPRRWLGVIPYSEALSLMRSRREAVLAGRENEIVYGLEHPTVITLGKHGTRKTDVLISDAELMKRGIELHQVERGGQATLHSPGQLVIYGILDLTKRRLSPREYVHLLEQAVIDWLGRAGLEAGRRADAPGVWVKNSKIAFLGLHVKKGVTIHGLALNLSNDLTLFDLIVPCAMPSIGISSYSSLTGKVIQPERVFVDLFNIFEGLPV